VQQFNTLLDKAVHQNQAEKRHKREKMLRKDTASLMTKLRLKEIRAENQRLADQQKYREMFAADGINLSSGFKKGGLSTMISENYRSR